MFKRKKPGVQLKKAEAPRVKTRTPKSGSAGPRRREDGFWSDLIDDLLDLIIFWD